MAQRQSSQRRRASQTPYQPAPPAQQAMQRQAQYPQQPQQQYVQVQEGPQQPVDQMQQQVKQSDRKRYLKMAEQGITLTAVVVAIVVILFFLQGQLLTEYALLLDVIRLIAILILIGGLAYIGLTGVREMRTG